nr:unnamed protein product [Digitaria exilis]
MTTLNLLSNLMSLAELHIDDCGESLTAEGLWPLITQEVYSCPKFFDYCPDPTAEVQGQDQKQLRGSRSKLRELVTDAGTGALFGVLCHASLTELEFHGANSFTAEQEEALQRLTSLRELRFHKCFKLKCLPASLHKLTGLKRLQIYNCHLITSLPKGGLPVSLQELYVSSERDIKDLQKECRNYIRDHPQIMLLL